MNANDPAFPLGEETGLTKRDYIAVEMFKAIIAREPHQNQFSPASFANLAYEFADALIAESV